MGHAHHSNVLFITGTGARVGKTRFTVELARALTAAGVKVVAVKPVESGCSDARAHEEDGVALAKATGQEEPRAALVRLAPPVAPALAAELSGVTIDFDELLIPIEKLAEEHDLVLLEGTRGLLEPITWEWCLVDVAQALEARAILVVPDQADAMNHGLLTIGALELAAIPLTHVVMTPPFEPDATTGHNAEAIMRLTGIQRVVVLSEDYSQVSAIAAELVAGLAD